MPVTSHTCLCPSGALCEGSSQAAASFRSPYNIGRRDARHLSRNYAVASTILPPYSPNYAMANTLGT